MRSTHQPTTLLAIGASAICAIAATGVVAVAQGPHVAAHPAAYSASSGPAVGRTGSAPGMTAIIARAGRIDGSTIVATARRFIGVRYVLGGTTPAAFDCSGFVRYVFAHHGIGLPRTAHEQAALGEAPAVGDTLQAGDLLFFYGGQGAQHIAMYVGGDTIIHASSTGHQVRLDLLTRAGGRRTWFNQRLIAVRRILPLDGVVYDSARVDPTFALRAAANREW
jgi:cell wall-associated NlpC family hydrolase